MGCDAVTSFNVTDLCVWLAPFPFDKGIWLVHLFRLGVPWYQLPVQWSTIEVPVEYRSLVQRVTSRVSVEVPLGCQQKCTVSTVCIFQILVNSV